MPAAGGRRRRRQRMCGGGRALPTCSSSSCLRSASTSSAVTDAPFAVAILSVAVLAAWVAAHRSLCGCGARLRVPWTWMNRAAAADSGLALSALPPASRATSLLATSMRSQLGANSHCRRDRGLCAVAQWRRKAQG